MGLGQMAHGGASKSCSRDADAGDWFRTTGIQETGESITSLYSYTENLRQLTGNKLKKFLHCFKWIVHSVGVFQISIYRESLIPRPVLIKRVKL